MLRRGPAIFLIAALIFAGLAAFGAHRWISAQAERAAAGRVVATSPVVVAASDLEPGQKLEARNLQVLNWPAGSLPPGHFSKVAQLEGRVLKSNVVKGEMMVAGKLAQEGLAGGLSAVVPEGFRAVTVRVDEVVGVAGFVQPGDRVDVLVTLARGPFSQDPATRLVLQDIPVLTVGEKFQEETEGSKVKRHKVTVVTLQVTPENGERLGLASNEGRILLALRNQGDAAPGQASAGVHLTDLIPAPTPPPPPPPVVEEDKGPKVEVIKGVARAEQSLIPGRDEVKVKAKPRGKAPAGAEPEPLPKFPNQGQPAEPNRSGTWR